MFEKKHCQAKFAYRRDLVEAVMQHTVKVNDLVVAKIFLCKAAKCCLYCINNQYAKTDKRPKVRLSLRTPGGLGYQMHLEIGLMATAILVATVPQQPC